MSAGVVSWAVSSEQAWWMRAVGKGCERCSAGCPAQSKVCCLSGSEQVCWPAGAGKAPAVAACLCTSPLCPVHTRLLGTCCRPCSSACPPACLPHPSPATGTCRSSSASWQPGAEACPPCGPWPAPAPQAQTQTSSCGSPAGVAAGWVGQQPGGWWQAVLLPCAGITASAMLLMQWRLLLAASSLRCSARVGV
jgi:hypothetical protein